MGNSQDHCELATNSAVCPFMSEEDQANQALQDQEALEYEDFESCFSLLDSRREGVISQVLLAKVLHGTGLLSQAQAEERAAQAASVGDDSPPLDLNVFRACIADAVQTAIQRTYERSNPKAGSANLPLPTTGTALLGVLEFVRRAALEDQDFRLAHHAKEMCDSLTAREETRRLQSISERHDTEQLGVQEAHMMQAMEFNSAWSTNMTEFEKQAQEIEDQVRQRQAEEFAAFQEQLRAQPPRSYKFSRELLQLRKSIETLAKQGKCVTLNFIPISHLAHKTSHHYLPRSLARSRTCCPHTRFLCLAAHTHSCSE